MIKIENVMVCGMSRSVNFRRSFNSQDKSDSFLSGNTGRPITSIDGQRVDFQTEENVTLGPKDLNRLANLVKSGDSHAKVNRMTWVWLDLTLPRRAWVDFDTYRIGRKEAINAEDIEYMSDSTMHTIQKRELTEKDFDLYTCKDAIITVNRFVREYHRVKSDPYCKDWDLQECFLNIKSNLPEGFLQTRTVNINYQALRHIFLDRENHRQPELRKFCDWIKTLPYAEPLIYRK